MKTRCLSRNAPFSPRKGRLVADQVRGLRAQAATEYLRFCDKKAATLILKALHSAVANAEQNEGADVDELFVSRIEIMDGAKLSRWRARARGRASPVMRRRSHILVEVSDDRAQGKTRASAQPPPPASGEEAAED